MSIDSLEIITAPEDLRPEIFGVEQDLQGGVEVITALEGLTPELAVLDPSLEPELALNAADFDLIELLFPGPPGRPVNFFESFSDVVSPQLGDFVVDSEGDGAIYQRVPTTNGPVWLSS